jgi:PAS domain-containing protein
MPDQAFVITDRAGVVQIWNVAAEALFGYDAAGQTFGLIVPPNIANTLGGDFARQSKAITSISIVHRQMLRCCVAAAPYCVWP